MGNTYIALLRGINVSGQKKIKMAELRNVLGDAGLKHLQTYIQSGNIVFDSELTDKEKIEVLITRTIQTSFGFDVPTLVIRKDNVEQILNGNPFLEKEEENKLYYVLLKSTPKQELVEIFNQLQYENERFHIAPDCVYLLCKNGYGRAKLNNNLIERKLGVQATTRNHKTMLKLLEMTSS